MCTVAVFALFVNDADAFSRTPAPKSRERSPLGCKTVFIDDSLDFRSQPELEWLDARSTVRYQPDGRCLRAHLGVSVNAASPWMHFSNR
jgi:hypothetical protein